MTRKRNGMTAGSRWALEASVLPVPSQVESGSEELDDIAIFFAVDFNFEGPLANGHSQVLSVKGRKRPAGVFGDPLAQSLHADALAAYYAADTSYHNTAGRKLDYIPLNSARRPTLDQAIRFYEPYLWYKKYGGPKVPAANIPGSSIHEFGFAIDVNLETDKKRIIFALHRYDWNDGKPGEPWHFELDKAASHARCVEFIKNETRPAAETYLAELKIYFDAKKLYDANKAAYLREKGPLDRERQRLLDVTHDLNRRRVVLTNERARIASEQSRLVREERALRDLRRRIDAMVYDRCPNRQDFQHCDHEDLKARWLRERQALEDDHASRSWRLDGDRDALRHSETVYNRSWASYESDLATFRTDKSAFDGRFAAFYRTWKAVSDAEGVIAHWSIRREELLTPIQALVQSFS